MAFLPTLMMPLKAQYQGSLRILEDISYYDPTYGYYVVYGVIQNQGSEAVCNVTITATFFDAQQETVDIVSGTAYLNIILGGRKSPFAIHQLGNLTAGEIKSYYLDITSSERCLQQNPLGLDLTGVVYYGGIVPGQSPGERSRYLGEATGDVLNIGAKITNDMVVSVVIYGQNGIIAVGACDPITLEKGFFPTGTEHFAADVSLPLEQAPKITHYMLVAESPEYTIKDEIDMNLTSDNQTNPPNNTILLIVMAIVLAVIIAVFLYRTRKKPRRKRRKIAVEGATPRKAW
jgi:hypothetical protein